MSLTDLFLLLLFIFALLVGLGTAMLRVLGFSPARGAVITTTFIFFGFWNPVGWVVLGLCAYLQVKENRARLEMARADRLMAERNAVRVEVGPVVPARGASQPELMRGNRT